MKGHKFLRTNTYKFKRMGGTAKKQKWRRPRGRHNKLREKIKGKPIRPTIGFKKPESEKVKITMINCIRDIEKVEKGQEVIIASIGKKKRKLFEEKLKNKGAKVLN
jgi:large subunit ribosomal protein L32e